MKKQWQKLRLKGLRLLLLIVGKRECDMLALLSLFLAQTFFKDQGFRSAKVYYFHCIYYRVHIQISFLLINPIYYLIVSESNLPSHRSRQVLELLLPMEE